VSEQLPLSLFPGDAGAGVGEGLVDRPALLVSERLVVPGGSFQAGDGRVLGTLEQHRRGLQGGLGQLVDQAVEVSAGHGPTVASRRRVSGTNTPMTRTVP